MAMRWPFTAAPATRPAEPDERALVRALASGDRAAAEALVEATYHKVFGLLCKLSGNRDTAADLTQETYRRAWQALASFDGRAAFSTWLYRIATNVFLNHVRRPRPVVPLEDELAATIGANEQPADDLLATAEQEALLRRAVVGLPDELRFAVSAHFWAEVPVREIARVEGISEVAVRKRLKRAFTLLRLALGEVAS